MTDAPRIEHRGREGWDGHSVMVVTFGDEGNAGRRTETDDADRAPAATPTGSRTPPSSTRKKSVEMTSTAPTEP